MTFKISTIRLLGHVIEMRLCVRVSEMASILSPSLALLLLGLGSSAAFAPSSLHGLGRTSTIARSSCLSAVRMQHESGEFSRRQAMQLSLMTSAIMKTKSASAQEQPLAGKPIVAPMITVFDSRGCGRVNTEYTGPKCGGEEDEMCIKVAMIDMRDRYGEWEVQRFAEQRKSYYGWKYQDLIKTGYNGMYKVADF